MKILCKLAKNNQAFALPTIVLLTLIMSFVAYGALLQSNNNMNLAYKQAYIQMARGASKAAIDFAQEEFDNAGCGDYTGTTETDLVVNDRYRVTFKSDVLETSADGYEKTIQGTGNVYLPKNSETAKYVFDIRSEIIRTYALCKTPDNFNPTIWLDSSEPDTLYEAGASASNTVTASTSFGSAGSSTRDTIEERVSNGTQTTNAWQSNDLEMHTCDNTEYSSSICSSSSTRYLYAGIVFQDVNVPQGADITSAVINYGCASGGASGPLTHRIRGIYNSSTDLHPDLFSSSGSNQVRTPMTTSSLRTSATATVNTNNCPPGNGNSMDVTSVVQEIIDNSNWDPATGSGRMGFGMERTSGNGARKFSKDNIQLVVTYSSASGPTLSNANNDSISEWHDISGNGNHAIATHGNIPTRVDNQIDGKRIVRFNNGNMLSSLTSALNNKREMTVLAVIKPTFSGSSTDGRVISGANSSASNDTTSGSSVIPLLRYSNNNGFSSVYSGSASSSTYKTNYNCSTTCNNQPFIASSVFRSEDSSDTETALKGNGQEGASRSGLAPSGSPYNFDINQVYFGGTRTGAMPGSGTAYLNGDYAEVVVYDYALTCREIESIEEYLREKWDIYSSPAETTCDAITIPTL